jgi:hypothetical protein
MAFQELSPPAKTTGGTGVKMTMQAGGRLNVSISGPALAHLGGNGTDQPGGSDAVRLRVLVDASYAVWQLRLMRDAGGAFRWSSAPLSKGQSMVVRVGKVAGVASDDKIAGLVCQWEPVDGQHAIDIDLPREFRPATAAAAVRPAAVPQLLGNGARKS